MTSGKENYRFVLQIYDQLGKLLPRVQVDPPGPNSKKIADVLGEYETPTLSPVRMGEIPTSWKQARGANVIDVDDNVYVDLTAGFCVGIAGHCHPKIVEAIRKQAEFLTHTPPAQAPHPTRAELLIKISEVVPRPLKRTHLLNTGGEAIDVALKLARLHSRKIEVMAFEGGFHGKTIVRIIGHCQTTLPNRSTTRSYPESFMLRFHTVTGAPLATKFHVKTAQHNV